MKVVLSMKTCIQIRNRILVYSFFREELDVKERYGYLARTARKLRIASRNNKIDRVLVSPETYFELKRRELRILQVYLNQQEEYGLIDWLYSLLVPAEVKDEGRDEKKGYSFYIDL